MAQWYYAEGPGRNVGPLTTEELAACFRRGQLMLDSQVWREGMAQWQPLRSVAAELGLDATASPTAPMPPPLPGAPGHASPRPGAPAIAPAPRGMSRGTIILIICLAAIIPMLAILGILAAIAIPAYQQYTSRAKLMEPIAAGDALKPLIERHLDFLRRPVPQLGLHLGHRGPTAAGAVPRLMPYAGDPAPRWSPI